MENQSSPNPNRRRRGSRSGGRNRNRQGSSGNSAERSSAPPTGEGSSRNHRNRNRNRTGSRSDERIRRNTPKPSLFQRILGFLSFGLLGKTSKKSKRGPATRNPDSARTSRGQGQGRRESASSGRESAATSRESASSGRESASSGRESASSGRESASTRRDASTADLSQRRRASTTEVTTPRLYVGNLDFAATEGELEDLFRGVGLVSSTEVVINSRTQQSKGFAFVEMGSVEEAKRAVAVLDNQDFMGRKLIVGGARSDGPKDGSASDEAASTEVAAD
jgi:hypothetical protein